MLQNYDDRQGLTNLFSTLGFVENYKYQNPNKT